MEVLQCKICQKEIKHERKTWAARLLNKHLLDEHQIDSKSYVIKYDHNGIEPTCLCGCGTKVTFQKGRFLTCYRDHIKNVSFSKERRDNLRRLADTRFKDNYLAIGLSKELLLSYWELYKTPEYTKEKITEHTGFDFRTIAHWWLKLELVSQSNLDRYKHLHKYVWAKIGDKNACFIEIPQKTIEQLVSYARFYKSQFNKRPGLTTVIEKHNLNYSRYIVDKRLQEYLKEEYQELFNSGNSSEIEEQFQGILNFYFGRRKVVAQYRYLKVFFDFCIDNRLLIEIDGEYWHGVKENTILDLEGTEKKKLQDLKKTEYAKELGMPLLRISDKEIKDPSWLIEIQKVINGDTIEIQSN